MIYVLGFLIGCCLGIILYHLERYRDKIYSFFKGPIKKKYGKAIIITINVCLWIMVWVTYYCCCILAGYILKPLL